jgi:hypothetical protein
MIYSKMLTYEFYKIIMLMFLNFFVNLQSYCHNKIKFLGYLFNPFIEFFTKKINTIHIG